jgi:hypothetical protein
MAAPPANAPTAIVPIGNSSVVGPPVITGNSIHVDLTRLTAPAVGGRAQVDATITFYIQFAPLLPNTAVETVQAFVTAFDVGSTASGGWDNCGYLLDPPANHIFTNTITSEWAGLPGITGAWSTSATAIPGLDRGGNIP